MYHGGKKKTGGTGGGAGHGRGGGGRAGTVIGVGVGRGHRRVPGADAAFSSSSGSDSSSVHDDGKDVSDVAFSSEGGEPSHPEDVNPDIKDGNFDPELVEDRKETDAKSGHSTEEEDEKEEEDEESRDGPKGKIEDVSESQGKQEGEGQGQEATKGKKKRIYWGVLAAGGISLLIMLIPMGGIAFILIPLNLAAVFGLSPLFKQRETPGSEPTNPEQEEQKDKEQQQAVDTLGVHLPDDSVVLKRPGKNRIDQFTDRFGDEQLRQINENRTRLAELMKQADDLLPEARDDFMNGVGDLVGRITAAGDDPDFDELTATWNGVRATYDARGNAPTKEEINRLFQTCRNILDRQERAMDDDAKRGGGRLSGPSGGELPSSLKSSHSSSSRGSGVGMDTH